MERRAKDNALIKLDAEREAKTDALAQVAVEVTAKFVERAAKDEALAKLASERAAKDEALAKLEAHDVSFFGALEANDGLSGARSTAPSGAPSDALSGAPNGSSSGANAIADDSGDETEDEEHLQPQAPAPATALAPAPAPAKTTMPKKAKRPKITYTDAQGHEIKPAQSGYVLFQADHRTRVAEQLTAQGLNDRGAVIGKLAELWRELIAPEKEAYQERGRVSKHSTTRKPYEPMANNTCDA